MEPNHGESGEERLGELLALLPPAPPAWVAAAQQLPRVERGVEQILALSETDAEFRRALLLDLAEAVRSAGQEPSAQLVRTLRERLGRAGDDGP